MAVTRMVAASFCALVALYWFGVVSAGGRGAANFRILTGILAAGCAAAGLATFSPGHARTAPLLRATALALACFALSHAALLYEWTRGDFDRYVWIIRQAEPCSSMGGGPGTLWMLATSTAFAVSAVVYASAGAIDRRTAVAGTVGAAILTSATALAMFPDPTLYARVLGCL